MDLLPVFVNVPAVSSEHPSPISHNLFEHLLPSALGVETM